MSLTRKREMMT